MTSSYGPAAPVLLLVMALGAPAALADDAEPELPAASATAPATAPQEPPGDVQVLVALRDGVPVRSDPGFVYREINHLAAGQEVVVVERRGDWWRLRPKGWVLAEHLGERPAAPAPPERTLLKVRRDGARVRSGPATDQPLVRTLQAGQSVEALGEEAGWWRLVGGGYLFGELAEVVGVVPGETRAPGPAPATVGGSAPGRRWSLLDLNGTLFEVTEIPASSSFSAALRREMASTGVLESDWSFMRLGIGLPPGQQRFRYSPDVQTTLIIDRAGKKYPNIWVRGPLDRLPVHLRTLLEPHVIEAGQMFEGVLMFRPTLDPAEIAEVWMFLGGRLQRLYESP